MGRKSTVDEGKTVSKLPPARSQEERERQLIALAYDVAEQRLLDGTATSQEVTHFLKLGSSKDRIEREILERQKELITAKTEALQSQRRVEELFANALDAMKSYSGYFGDNDE